MLTLRKHIPSHTNSHSNTASRLHKNTHLHVQYMVLALLGLKVQTLTGATHGKMYKLLVVPGGLNPFRTDVDEREVYFSSPDKYDS